MPRRPGALAVAAVLIALAGGCVQTPAAPPSSAPVTPAPPTPAPSATDTPPAPAAPPLSAGGEIAFYSERDGNAEIYVMKADGSNWRRLTEDSADDVCPDWSPDGTQLVFMTSRHDPNPAGCFPNCSYEIYAINADGSNSRRLTESPANDMHPAWSPDGRHIAFVSSRDGNDEIYVMDADGGHPSRLTDSLAAEMHPTWSPDGRKIAFNSDRDGNWEIYVMGADGSGLGRLTDSPAWDLFPDWSPDGTQIVFFTMIPQAEKQDIIVMAADGSDQRRLTDTSRTIDEDPAWSPDGVHIAFQTDRDGNFEIYVMAVDGSDQQALSKAGSDEYWPSWRP